jgi:medium-chain acyl-[acyl-carrier-protein] hydrolase
MSGLDSRWLLTAPPDRSAAPRLLCFPYAGGGASIYRSWIEGAPQLAVVPVQLPGRENRLRDRPFTECRALAATLADVFGGWLTSPGSPPSALFGHSMGALIAFELARTLRARGCRPPARLLLSGRTAPHAPPTAAPLHALPDAAFTAGIRALGGTPDAVLQHAELMALMLPTLRADFTLVETYELIDEAPLAIPFSVFGGEDDEVTAPALAAWAMHTSAGCVVRRLPGDHFFLHASREPLLRAIAADLAPALRSARSNSSFG